MSESQPPPQQTTLRDIGIALRDLSIVFGKWAGRHLAVFAMWSQKHIARLHAKGYGPHMMVVGASSALVMVLFIRGCWTDDEVVANQGQPATTTPMTVVPSPPPRPPSFSIVDIEHHHGVTEAHWVITIRNDGGRGTMLFNWWIGDLEESDSRKVVYEDTITLEAQAQTTRSVRWNHGVYETIVDLWWYGGGSGASFYPQ